MSYHRIFERVYLSPLCISPSRFASIHAFLLPRLRGEGGLEVQAGSPRPVKNPYNGKRAQKAGPGMNADGTIDPRFYREPIPGLAVIPVYGALAKNLSAWEEDCGGGTDINAIAEAVRQVSEADDIRAVLFDFDSPGGEVTGIPELAAQIKALGDKKFTCAFTDATLGSAAYWLASQCNEIYGTRSANIGSIGTYLAWLDETVAMQLQGVTLQLFAEGAHKGIGLPGRPLTQDDRVLLQSRVSEINGWFTGAVTAARPGITDATMQGQTFSGLESLSANLIDGIVSSFDEVLEMIEMVENLEGDDSADPDEEDNEN